MPGIELIARGVLLKDNLILLVRQKGDMYSFLPGGHIEFGEPAEQALKREIREELGISVMVTHLVGIVEHSWQEKDGLHQEMNLIFVLNSPELDSTTTPKSLEAHLEFLWHPINNLKQSGLRPDILCELLPKWLERESQWCTSFKKED